MKNMPFKFSLLLLTLVFTIPVFAQKSLMSDTYTPQNSAILLVDHQKLTMDWLQSMPKDQVIANIRMLARLGGELHIPTIVTTTLETQVGPTIQDIQDIIPAQYANRIKRGGNTNCFLDPNFVNAVKNTGRINLIIAGLTTDICLFHTVEGALKQGYHVWVVATACGGMLPIDDELTFARLRSLGVIVSSGNQLLTQLYPDFGTADGQKAAKINLEEIVTKIVKH